MTILVYDVEVSSLDLMLRTYDLKNRIKYFNHEDIVRDWTMLGAAWKVLGEDRVRCVSVSHKDVFNDYEVICALHKALARAEVVIGHNSDGFDIKKFNTRAVYYGLEPLQPKKQIDTIKIAKKYFKFTSNSLRYIASYLGLGDKGESPEWDLILAGDKKALAAMREYNKRDVTVTEAVYLRLRDYHHTHPDVSTVTRDVAGEAMLKCPRCDSVDIKKDGTFPIIKNGMIVSRKQRYSCTSCHKYIQPKM